MIVQDGEGQVLEGPPDGGRITYGHHLSHARLCTHKDSRGGTASVDSPFKGHLPLAVDREVHELAESTADRCRIAGPHYFFHDTRRGKEEGPWRLAVLHPCHKGNGIGVIERHVTDLSQDASAWGSIIHRHHLLQIGPSRNVNRLRNAAHGRSKEGYLPPPIQGCGAQLGKVSPEGRGIAYGNDPGEGRASGQIDPMKGLAFLYEGIEQDCSRVRHGIKLGKGPSLRCILPCGDQFPDSKRGRLHRSRPEKEQNRDADKDSTQHPHHLPIDDRRPMTADICNFEFRIANFHEP